MDSYVHGWRAMVWGRVWTAVAVLTFAWSAGVGLALRAVAPSRGFSGGGNCLPTPVRSLVTAPADWLSLPVHALIAAPLGAYISGLQFALVAFVVVLAPAALLRQGRARRILSAPVLIVLAALLIVAGWTFELSVVSEAGRLPAIVCSDSGY